MVKKYLLLVIKYLILILTIILIMFPIYYLIAISFMSDSLILKNIPYFIPDGLNHQNYSSLFDNNFWNALGLTLANVSLVLVVKLFILMFAGYGLSVINPKLKNILFLLFLFISIIPEVSIYLNLLKLRNEISVLKNSIILTLSITSLFSFFSITYFYNSFKDIRDKENNLFKIDQLKWYEKFYYGYLPKLKLPILLTIIFTTIEVWNSFFWPSLILSGQKYPSGNSYNNITTWYMDLGVIESGKLFNIVSAGAVVSLIVPLGVYLIFSKIINRNLYNSI